MQFKPERIKLGCAKQRLVLRARGVRITCHAGGVETESYRKISPRQVKERVAEIILVQQTKIVLDKIANIKKNLTTISKQPNWSMGLES